MWQHQWPGEQCFIDYAGSRRAAGEMRAGPSVSAYILKPSTAAALKRRGGERDGKRSGVTRSGKDRRGERE